MPQQHHLCRAGPNAIVQAHHAHARKVLVNEHPGLHLVWWHERIFVKPIPAYFYSKAFWDFLEDANLAVYQAAVGFMRSYYFLIQYEIDFDEACDKKLIPKKPGGTHPTYKEFCAFILPFKEVNDDFVCRRYHYGELRLTRINHTAMLFRGKLAYFHIYPQWGSFLAHTLAPIITVFAVFSVLLNSMQVALAAQQVGPDAVGGKCKLAVVGGLKFQNGAVFADRKEEVRNRVEQGAIFQLALAQGFLQPAHFSGFAGGRGGRLRAGRRRHGNGWAAGIAPAALRKAVCLVSRNHRRCRRSRGTRLVLLKSAIGHRTQANRLGSQRWI